MYKKKLAFSVLCVLAIITLFTGCTGEKIENIESITARFGTDISVGSADSQIYPSLDAYKLEQVYEKWNIYPKTNVKFKSISFDFVIDKEHKINTDVSSFNLDVLVIKGDKDEDRVLVEMSKKLNVNSPERLTFTFLDGQTFAKNESIEILFNVAANPNSIVKFRLDNIELVAF